MVTARERATVMAREDLENEYASLEAKYVAETVVLKEAGEILGRDIARLRAEVAELRKRNDQLIVTVAELREVLAVWIDPQDTRDELYTRSRKLLEE